MNIRQLALMILIMSCVLPTKLLYGQENCERYTVETLPLLTQALNNNDFDKIDPLLNSIEASCGINEFVQRLRILMQIIEKKNTAAAIDLYWNSQFDKSFLQRLDAADQDDFSTQYEQHKEKYNFYPLRHPLDGLIKVRAQALLVSDSYTLTDQEKDILLLFSDTDVSSAEQDRQADEQDNQQRFPAPKVYRDRQKAKLGYVPSIGVVTPLGGANKIFGTNISFGFMLTSSLERKFIFEGGFKVRINSNDRNIDYNYEGSNVSVNSSATAFMGGAVGYKVFDNDKCILIPKGILGIDITDTGITESAYSSGYYDPDGYYYDGGYTDRMVTINNVHLGLGLASLFRMKNQKYIGFELGYHYAPYDASSKVLIPIQANYGSLELFFRF
ncbi:MULTISPECIES: hypothetical protein [Sphingobacterium]|uniref:hypothetical protein n=1 Tax=Sphingobacterium TaxID=28453 RepID=UPI000EE101E2|nr:MULTISPECIES: hypothetical protein [Sphingobacterium]HAK27660.1 hypothetical protein [Sphingobacterium sp.]